MRALTRRLHIDLLYVSSKVAVVEATTVALEKNQGAKLGIALTSVEVTVAGDLDVHGFFGLDPAIRPGF